MKQHFAVPFIRFEVGDVCACVWVGGGGKGCGGLTKHLAMDVVSAVVGGVSVVPVSCMTPQRPDLHFQRTEAIKK